VGVHDSVTVRKRCRCHGIGRARPGAAVPPVLAVLGWARGPTS